MARMDWTRWAVRALRTTFDESQAEFADRIGCAAETVRRWEAGEQALGYEYSRCFTTVLEQRLTPAQRACYEAERARLEAEHGSPPATGASLGDEAPQQEGKPVHRRENLQMFAALVGAGMTGGLHWDAFTPDVTVDAGLVADYEAGLDGLVDVYARGNPMVMLPAAAGFADGLAPVLRRAPTQELGLRLSAVALDAHAIAGVLAFDAGSVVLTERHFAQMSRIAERSGDPILRARAWTLQAKYEHSPIHVSGGSARQAVESLGKAKALARHADGFTRAFLAISLAEEAAEMGDVGQCEWAIEHAAHTLARAEGAASGLFSTRGVCGGLVVYAAAKRGRIAGLAGHADEADRCIADHITLASNARQRVGLLCDLASVRIDAAQPEGACEALTEAAALARASGSPGKVVRVQAVRAKMPPPWATLPCVTDLDDQLFNPIPAT